MQRLKGWIGKWWKHILAGALAIVIILGITGMMISREVERAESRCQERYEELEGRLDRDREEDSRRWEENSRRLEEYLRLPELTVERGVRVPLTEEWTDRLEAKTGRQLEFLITINSTAVAHNVWVQAELPSLLFYKDNLRVDGVAFFGDVTEGVNIGTVTPCKARVVTFEVQVATASLFPVGKNILIVPIEVWADCVEAEIGEIYIVVERKAPASSGGGSSKPPKDGCDEDGGPKNDPDPNK